MLYRLIPAALAGAILGSVAPGPARPAGVEQPRHHPAAIVARHDSLPVEQLALAKRATARYRDVQQAIADGYADINVVIPNMGRHFLKQALMDSTFDVEHPELLVYSPDSAGKLQLVAVEYAVPTKLSANAPEGFKGSADQWFINQQFDIWTLHAWVWKDNPAGIFYPTNPNVP
jgi:hypothetical protein